MISTITTSDNDDDDDDEVNNIVNGGGGDDDDDGNEEMINHNNLIELECIASKKVKLNSNHGGNENNGQYRCIVIY